MDDTLIHTLYKPLPDLTEISLRMPTVDEIAKLSTESEKFGGVRALKSLLARIGQVEVAVIGLMGARDFKVCKRFVDGFNTEEAEPLEGDSATHTLCSPLPGLAEVKLREPTLDEIGRLAEEGGKLGQIVAMRNLIAKMNQVDAKLIGSMGLRDFRVCEKFLDGFFD